MSRRIDMSIISNFIRRNFSPSDIESLSNSCPNKMLWEAVCGDDAEMLTEEEVILLLRKVPQIYAMQEPLSAFCQNKEPEYFLASSSTFADELSISRATASDPLYLISYDFSWMIVMTAENTPSGEELCVLLRNLSVD